MHANGNHVQITTLITRSAARVARGAPETRHARVPIGFFPSRAMKAKYEAKSRAEVRRGAFAVSARVI